MQETRESIPESNVFKKPFGRVLFVILIIFLGLLFWIFNGFIALSDFFGFVDKVDRSEVHRTLRYIASREENARVSNGGKYLALSELCRSMPENEEICEPTAEYLGFRFEVRVSADGQSFAAKAQRAASIRWLGRDPAECLMIEGQNKPVVACELERTSH